jgi:hypothetical protein
LSEGSGSTNERYLASLNGRNEGDYRSSSAPPKVALANGQGLGPNGSMTDRTYYDFMYNVWLRFNNALARD